MKRILGLQLLACLAISSADANTMTPQTLPFAGGTGNFSDTLTFNRFDTSLGTLTGVEISMTTAGYGILSVYNNSDNNKKIDFSNGSASVPVLVVGPDGVSIRTTLSVQGIADSVHAGTFYFNGTLANYSANGFVPNGNLGSYSGLGAGTFTLNALVAGGTFSGTQDGGDPHLFFGGSETVSGNVTVTYTYDTPVPDGGLTAMLLGMGMLALGSVRRMVK